MADLQDTAQNPQGYSYAMPGALNQMPSLSQAPSGQSPLAIAVGGYETGLALKQQQQQLQQQKQQQQQFQSDMSQLANNPNPTASDYARMILLHPQMADTFKKSWDLMDSSQQKDSLQSGSKVYAALQNNAPDIAASIMSQQAQAYQNAGNETKAKEASNIVSLIQQNPSVAKTSIALGLAGIMGPDKFASTFSTLEKTPSEVQSSEAGALKATYEAQNTPQRLALENSRSTAEIRNIDSQISDRAGRLGLDKDKLQSDVQMKLYELNQKLNPALNLGPDAKKIINDSAISASTSQQTAGQMLDLANRLDKQGGGYGAASTFGEWIKDVTGNQNQVSLLRQEYTRLRNTSVMSMLPPGSASDKDVAFALQGFPPLSADSRTISQFLRGMAKISATSSAVDNAKAEWANSVGHLGKTRSDIEVEGIRVPAGVTFNDFLKKYGSQLSTKVNTQAQQGHLNQRSYMRWSQPGAQ